MTHQEYIDSLHSPLQDAELDAIYREAVDNQIPAVRPLTARFLHTLVKTGKPKNLLEIGTGSAHSTLWMAKAMDSSACLTTLERDKNRFELSVSRLSSYRNVTVLCEDAFRFLDKTTEQFDFIFLDCQKRDYIELYDKILPRLVQNGLLVADNFLFGGRVLDLSDADREKYADGVERLKRFNERVSQSGDFFALFLPFDDGVMLARKQV